VGRKRQHSERKLYLVYVLWLKGHTERSIGMWCHLRSKQVSGIVARSEYADRSGMADTDRQARLDELKAIRMNESNRPTDGGALDKFVWEIQPLARDQRRFKRRAT